MGSEAGQELRADSRNVELEQLHPGPGDEVLAEEGAGVNREIRLHSLEQARWQELRIALGLHGQRDQADQNLAEQHLQGLQKHQRQLAADSSEYPIRPLDSRLHQRRGASRKPPHLPAKSEQTVPPAIFPNMLDSEFEGRLHLRHPVSSSHLAQGHAVQDTQRP